MLSGYHHNPSSMSRARLHNQDRRSAHQGTINKQAAARKAPDPRHRMHIHSRNLHNIHPQNNPTHNTLYSGMWSRLYNYNSLTQQNQSHKSVHHGHICSQAHSRTGSDCRHNASIQVHSNNRLCLNHIHN